MTKWWKFAKLVTFSNFVKLIKNDYNAGFSKAVNQGAKISKGKYFLILNPDTLFIEDSLFKIWLHLSTWLDNNSISCITSLLPFNCFESSRVIILIVADS